ncbi:hypothetical protein N473_02725 [Pseudoalteromonas luteoviolacea CPMOR-1]|uniref:Uncharacterized protein n=1 Tax=Pseudoalteromonas luteoviolacea CPMOR-1 TaxID=1365248 RepID=A0A167IR58_9GAMM|nr:hypothetical protein [Pseudoalteromonas luteoviolacea]KZN59847.1 hypothetical protein N473_02725 [Pseudoalteromonas luteoviolacea CPMOR-1]
MHNGQYRIYFKSQVATSQNDCATSVECGYIIGVESTESGNLTVTFMQGFDSFLATFVYPEKHIAFSPEVTEGIFEFIVFNDPDYGMYLSQESLPDKRLLEIINHVVSLGNYTSQDVFQLIQTHIIRDISIIVLNELEEVKRDIHDNQLVEQTKNRARLVKSEQGQAGCRFSSLEMKKIVGEQLEGDFAALLADAWEAVHNETSYLNTGMQYLCYELDNNNGLAYHEFDYQSCTPKQHKHIIRKVIRID